MSADDAARNMISWFIVTHRLFLLDESALKRGSLCPAVPVTIRDKSPTPLRNRLLSDPQFRCDRVVVGPVGTGQRDARFQHSNVRAVLHRIVGAAN